MYVRSGIRQGTDKALDYFSNEGNHICALFEGAGKDPVWSNVKGKYDDIDECIEKLKYYFDGITPDPKTIYILKWWDEKPELNKGKISSSADGSVKFVTNTNDEINEVVNGYRERIGNYNNAILSKLEAIEQKIAIDQEEEEEIKQEPQGFSGIIAGIVNNPDVQVMLANIFMGALDRFMPLKKETVAINGFDDNKLDEALMILKKHDPELESDLMLLAKMAESNPGQFKFLLSMLRK